MLFLCTLGTEVQGLSVLALQVVLHLCQPLLMTTVHMQSNIDNTTNWALTDEEYKAITGIKHQLRLLDGYPWLHPDGPYRSVNLHYQVLHLAKR